jgi:transposase-like protein
MSKIVKKEKAIKLRIKGYSIKEIANDLDVAQSSISLWVKNIKLSGEALARIRANQEAGIKKSMATNRAKRLQRIKEVTDRCEIFSVSKKISKSEAKIYLALLYWGEGAKSGSRVVFMNSDPLMVNSFISLLRNGFDVDENKLQGVLHLHSYHDKDNMISFWSNVTGICKNKISIYQKKESGVIKNEGYKGCFSLRYGDVSTMQEILLIIDRFAKLDYN